MTTETYFRHGSWEWGKGRVFPIFPKAFFFFLNERMTGKITKKRGAGDATIFHPPIGPFSSRLAQNFLKLPKMQKEVR